MAAARIALIGLGNVAQIHLQAYGADPMLQVVAGFDTDPARVRDAAAAHAFRGFHDLAEMLDEADIEVACVLTPARVHETAVLACAAAGISVLCEKPLALTTESCDRMIEACRAAGVTLGYGASYRFLPAVVRAKEIIDSGALGEILVMRESAIGGNGVDGRQTLGPAHFPDGGPGGSGMGLIDHGIHLVDLFAWLSGSTVMRAAGRGNRAGRSQAPEYLVLEFAGGALGELVYEDGTFPTELPGEGLFSWGQGWDVGGATPPGKWQAHPGSIHVHGTLGSLRIFHYANALFLRTAGGLTQVDVGTVGSPVQFSLQMRAFVEAVRAGSPAPVPAAAGREACRLVMGVYD